MRSHLFAIAALLLCSVAAAQNAPATLATAPDQKPLPNIPDLVALTTQHQKELETVREHYTYHEQHVGHELNSDGSVKKIGTFDFDVFYVNNHSIGRLTKKDGKDLTPDEVAKENERVDKEIANARSPEKKNGQGINLSASRILNLSTVSNPRRIQMNGHDTIVFDFTGNHKAPAHDLSDEAIRALDGTFWIDEQDHQVVRLEAHLKDNFHIGGGLLVNIKKGSGIVIEQGKVNGEIWMPYKTTFQFEGRMLLLKGFYGNGTDTFTDYRVMRSDSVILPGVAPVDENAAPPAATSPAAPK